MLTGIELALAILPIVITLTEGHKLLKAGKVLRSSKVKEIQLYQFWVDLQDELSFLATTLGSVVGGVPGQSTPGALLSLSPEQLQAVDAVLGDRAKTFHSLLDRILEGLDALLSDKTLRLNEADVSVDGPSPLFAKLNRLKQIIEDGEASSTLAERFRFTRHEQTRTWALKRVRDNNEKMERLLRGKLLQSSNELHSLKRKRPKPARLRRFSEPLYDKIAQKWPKAHQCHHHEARLSLGSCCSEERQKAHGDCLDMVLSVTDVNVGGSSWLESVILIPPEANHSHTESTVKFVVDERMYPTATAQAPNLVGEEIEADSLCSLIAQAHRQQAALQVIFDRGKLWQSKSRRRSLLTQTRTLTDVTLKDLLGASDTHIRLREKHILAVTLAHAALHCSEGPWLCPEWGKEHISFFRSDPSSEPDLGRPYLKVLFDDVTADADDARTLFNVHASPSLLSLGVLLLEIHLSGSIETKYLDEDLMDGKPNENTNLTTAMRLLDGLDGDVCECYRAAIQACLEGDWETFDSEELRKKIYEEIVLPLERELEHGFKLTPEMLPVAQYSGRRRNTF